MSDVTLILQAVGRGEKKAAEELLPMVYEELRRLATIRMANEAAGQTLQPTALVHEAWLRMVQSGERNWKNRAYFFSSAAEAMRRILIDNARRKARMKHGGGQQRVGLELLETSTVTPDEKLLMMDEALSQLEVADPERARVVILKFFSGLTNPEVARTLDISESTVVRHWVCAKDWLVRHICGQGLKAPSK
jgi:RNA polymerase sigma factor (TIGR02999 family)